MPGCAAFGCSNRSSKESDIKFHIFPKDPERREKWVRALRRDNFTPSDHTVICSEHFLPTDYKHDEHGYLRKILKNDAIPSVFPAFPTHLQPATKKRRILVRNTTDDASSSLESAQLPIDLDPPEPSEISTPKEVIEKDHPYAFPSSIEAAKEKCDKLQRTLEDKLAKEKKQSQQLRLSKQREEKTSKKLKDVLAELGDSKLLSSNSISILEGRFSDEQMKVVKDMLGEKGKGTRYSQEMKDFAVTLHYHSNKAYDFARKLINLPDPSTMRKWTGIIDCYPGFQIPALNYLKGLRKQELELGKNDYENVSLVIDAITLKEQIQFDKKSGKLFGFVDLGGGCSGGSEDVPAKDALVLMVVGYKKFWKLPIAYFLIKGVDADTQAGFIREALIRTFDCGMIVRNVTLDGTVTNISTYEKFGCKIFVTESSDIIVEFPHPHPDAKTTVLAYPDPVHHLKNTRNMFGEYKVIHWPGEGAIKWEYIKELHNIQEDYNFRLGNKLTGKHVSYHKNKMKVNLAAQLMSDSVSRSLKLLHNEQWPGFKSPDVLVTCRFIELHDQLFDILNSRSKYGFGTKAALTPSNIDNAEIVFSEFIAMYDVLERTDGVKIIHSGRRTGPLCFIADIFAIRKFVSLMKSGEIAIDYIRTHKMCQDHLEHWFGAVRQRFGFSMYPNPLQFMYSFRLLLVHGGKDIIHSSVMNCIAQDETVQLKVAYTCPDRMQILIRSETDDTVETQFVLDQVNEEVVNREKSMRTHQCNFIDCRICSCAISYIAGYYVYIIEKSVTCSKCRLSLHHSTADPCINDALIRFKDYCPDDPEKGLQVPSGSLCKLLFLCEKVFRRHYDPNHLSQLDIDRKLLREVLLEINMREIFPLLADHAFETSDGIDNHCVNLVKLICRKYLILKTNKATKDRAIRLKIGYKDGHDMHRNRVHIGK